ncbi:unnamed protein product [marine sediment metagenome]|uniref:Citrate transporter-like domain-containing protein n=1 Tax=marine sediment metagenome TaxID=412755 RepID=X1AET2_9ZZZZ
MGTTGAAMILIRPLLVTNSERKSKVHTVLFFIAIVANCGGLLTPLGDPPLFLLYLRGAPFTWFFELLPEWLFINISLLLIYYIVDLYFYKREAPEDIKQDLEKKILTSARNSITVMQCCSEEKQTTEAEKTLRLVKQYSGLRAACNVLTLNFKLFSLLPI